MIRRGLYYIPSDRREEGLVMVRSVRENVSLLAKALTREIALFIFDEPTVGVDVGTRVAIYGFIRDLCEVGAGVLLISSDLPEILHLTNRVYVMYRGAVRAELRGAQITPDAVLGHFFEGGAAA